MSSNKFTVNWAEIGTSIQETLMRELGDFYVTGDEIKCSLGTITDEPLEASGNLTFEELRKTLETLRLKIFYKADEAVPVHDQHGDATVLFFEAIDCYLINPRHLPAFTQAAEESGMRLVEMSDEEYSARLKTLNDRLLKGLISANPQVTG